MGHANYSRHRRDYGKAALAAMRWIRNPVSEAGAKQVYRMIYATMGPDVHRLVARLRERPETAALLRTRPDLGRALTDMATLAKLPEGSVGRTYHEFMKGDDVFPGYILAGLAYKDGHFDRLVDWDADATWLLERGSFTHDITHVLAGYGTDFAGEAILIPFSVASVGVPRAIAVAYAAEWAMVTFAAIQPPVPFATWFGIVTEAAHRGADLADRQPFPVIPLEELLATPLDEARRRVGLRPIRHARYVTPEGFLDSRGWNRGWLGRRMADGFGTMPEAMNRVKRARQVIEDAGIPVKTVMSARARDADRAYALLEAGAGRAAVLAAFEGRA